MLNVIVVPETADFTHSVSHGDEIFINLNLGVPNLDGQNARYAAPCWIHGDPPGVRRLYHITGVYDDGSSTVLQLGNSFLLTEVWDHMGQSRRFEYHPLKNFGFVEVQPGFLLKYNV